MCGNTEHLEIHHIDSDRKNNTPENLIPLCKTHHRTTHKEKIELPTVAFIYRKIPPKMSFTNLMYHLEDLYGPNKDIPNKKYGFGEIINIVEFLGIKIIKDEKYKAYEEIGIIKR